MSHTVRSRGPAIARPRYICPPPPQHNTMQSDTSFMIGNYGHGPRAPPDAPCRAKWARHHIEALTHHPRPLAVRLHRSMIDAQYRTFITKGTFSSEWARILFGSASNRGQP